MSGNLDSYRAQLETLAQLGERMLIDLSLRDAPGEENQRLAEPLRGCFEQHYQRWYTEAQAVVAQLIPGRTAEFERLYLGDGRRRAAAEAELSIQDWLAGRSQRPHIDLPAVSMRLKLQLEIFKAAEARLQSSLFEMRRLVRADLFGSELDACRELAAHGFLRAAGAIAGVLLEKHLRQTIEQHGVVVRKSEPTINDFNDHLKKAGVLDVPSWRHIQRLADVRNLCGHSKHREPTRDEVEELIEGVERLLKTPL